MSYLIAKRKFIEKLVERCKLKGFSSQTIKSYSYHVSNFLDFLDKSRHNPSKERIKSNLLLQNILKQF
jgi:hypothetical protein